MSMNAFRSRKHPGHNAAPDGETVTISAWESTAAAKAWARHPEHLAAQARWRQDYDAQFTPYACDETSLRQFPPGVFLGAAEPVEPGLGLFRLARRV